MKALLKYISMSLLALAMFSCSQSEDDPTQQQAPNKEKVQVTFTISLDDQQVGTRSIWGDNELEGDTGTSIENYIDMDNLQVLLYTSNNQYAAKVINMIYWPTGNSNAEYEFIGDVSTTLAAGTYKVMVFANCPEVNAQTDLSTMSFTPDSYTQPVIPMWGVKQADLSLVLGKRDNLGTISVLRSMAKIEVGLSDELVEYYNLQGVSFDRYNNEGYCLPSGYAGITATENLYMQGANQSFHPNINGFTNESLAFNQIEANQLFGIYVPEFNNDNTVDDGTAQMILIINDQEYKLKFQDYSSNVPVEMDIVRNHYYRYMVTDINDKELELTLEYQVQEWVDITNPNIEFN